MARSRLAVIAAVGLAVVAALVALIGGPASAAAPGALDPKGCIDDNDTGADTCAKEINNLGGAKGVAVSPDGKSVYVIAENDDAIVTFKRKANGKLRLKGCINDNDTPIDTCAKHTDGMAAPSSVVISRDGKSVYVASENDDAVTWFKRKANGTLKPKGCIDDNDTMADPNQGEDDCAQSTDGLNKAVFLALSRDGKSLYAVSETDDAIVAFKRKPTGALKPQGCIDDNDPMADPTQGEDTCSVDTNGLHVLIGVAVSPDGKSVYTASENEGVARFNRSPNGLLAPGGCVQDDDVVGGPCADTAPALTTPDTIAVSPDGDSVYVTTEGDNSLARFDRKASGALEAKGCIGLTGSSECSVESDVLEEPAVVVVSKDGKSVYVTAESAEAVIRFDRAGTGKLTERGCVEDADDPGDCARHAHALLGAEGVALSPNDRSLYVAASQDSGVVRFDRAD